VPLSPGAPDPLALLYQDFRATHDRVYGHSTEAPARIVNLRAIHRSAAAQARPEPYAAVPRSSKAQRRILTAESAGFVEAAIHERSSLDPGTRVAGPAIVEQGDTTTLIEPGWSAEVAPNGSVILTPN
jgi:N-methylhydantoinase A/oxoprolinase/acetone carboxylase beta subunit